MVEQMASSMRKIKYFSIGLSVFLASVIFIFPLISSSEYSFRGFGGKGHNFSNYLWIIKQDGFLSHLLLSLELGVLAALLNLILMVPTALYVELKAKELRPLVEFLCLLPLVIPVVSLAIGAQAAMPEFLQNSQFELVFFFVIISLPYTYRALQTSISNFPLQTLVEAARGLGATRTRTILTVIVPAIKSGISGSFFLCFALSIGEFTLTSLLHWETFPTWTVVVSQQNILGAIALSVFSFIFAIFLMVGIGTLSESKIISRKRGESFE